MTARAKSFLFVVLLAVLVLATVAANAQFAEKGTFNPDMSVAIDIGETINVEGQIFPVFENKSGKNFVKAISAKGKEYPVWIHEQTTYIHNGFIVHKTTKGKYCYYKLNKNNYPYPVWLDKTE